MTRKKRRLILITACGSVLALAVGLILFAMSGSIVFFRSPSEIEAQRIAPGTRLRLGGLVEDGSLKRGPGQTVAFAVTDKGASIAVQYTGLLPDLFREGQGVVAEGVLEPGNRFLADTVLAKHDEAYMPREVAEALKKQGRWQEGGARTAAQEGGARAAVQEGGARAAAQGSGVPAAAQGGGQAASADPSLGDRSER